MRLLRLAAAGVLALAAAVFVSPDPSRAATAFGWLASGAGERPTAWSTAPRAAAAPRQPISAPPASQATCGCWSTPVSRSAATAAGPDTAALIWDPAPVLALREPPVAGYEVSVDGVVADRVGASKATVALPGPGPHQFSVRAFNALDRYSTPTALPFPNDVR